ncbi:hypothetical protein H2199_004344 [Coniosporium tulheliwenetii]|uniref:Uncharacterized protein n=1 Tax=Coniosporium tulheliwenetii TaxID=3383036 RepID=A0ACC2Z590_9PEZI|nr:hypothetical protein H2199_004344 [Cladosporium sp. JES 115]
MAPKNKNKNKNKNPAPGPSPRTARDVRLHDLTSCMDLPGILHMDLPSVTTIIGHRDTDRETDTETGTATTGLRSVCETCDATSPATCTCEQPVDEAGQETVKTPARNASQAVCEAVNTPSSNAARAAMMKREAASTPNKNTSGAATTERGAASTPNKNVSEPISSPQGLRKRPAPAIDPKAVPPRINPSSALSPPSAPSAQEAAQARAFSHGLDQLTSGATSLNQQYHKPPRPPSFGDRRARNAPKSKPKPKPEEQLSAAEIQEIRDNIAKKMVAIGLPDRSQEVRTVPEVKIKEAAVGPPPTPPTPLTTLPSLIDAWTNPNTKLSTPKIDAEKSTLQTPKSSVKSPVGSIQSGGSSLKKSRIPTLIRKPGNAFPTVFDSPTKPLNWKKKGKEKVAVWKDDPANVEISRLGPADLDLKSFYENDPAVQRAEEEQEVDETLQRLRAKARRAPSSKEAATFSPRITYHEAYGSRPALELDNAYRALTSSPEATGLGVFIPGDTPAQATSISRSPTTPDESQVPETSSSPLADPVAFRRSLRLSPDSIYEDEIENPFHSPPPPPPPVDLREIHPALRPQVRQTFLYDATPTPSRPSSSGSSTVADVNLYAQACPASVRSASPALTVCHRTLRARRPLHPALLRALPLTGASPASIAAHNRIHATLLDKLDWAIKSSVTKRRVALGEPVEQRALACSVAREVLADTNKVVNESSFSVKDEVKKAEKRLAERQWRDEYRLKAYMKEQEKSAKRAPGVYGAAAASPSLASTATLNSTFPPASSAPASAASTTGSASFATYSTRSARGRRGSPSAASPSPASSFFNTPKLDSASPRARHSRRWSLEAPAVLALELGGAQHEAVWALAFLERVEGEAGAEGAEVERRLTVEERVRRVMREREMVARTEEAVRRALG